MIHALVFDTETTGLLLPGAAALKDQPKIIELAAVVIEKSEGSFKIAGEISWLIHPGEEITAEITKITGITNDDLRGKPSFAALAPEIAEFFIGATHLFAHNLPFDVGMLTNELKRCGKEFAFPYPPTQICTVAAFEAVKGRRMKLMELYEWSLKKKFPNAHRALADARALAEVVVNERLLVAPGEEP